jgi:2-hydroxycyclohexanecarboxyl-CoA dehydrogenase
MSDDVGSDGRLGSKVAVVSGGGQGIGRGVALAFAGEGANVAILDLTVEKSGHVAGECEARGPDAIGLRCDVADRAEVDEAVRVVVERFGRIDVVVTAALPKIAVEPFELTSAERMEKLWRVGFLGVTNVMQSCLPYLKSGGGRVINFGSGAGIGAARGYAAYGPVKEAVRSARSPSPTNSTSGPRPTRAKPELRWKEPYSRGQVIQNTTSGASPSF